MTGGAVAAGSPHTVEAGVRALRLGGNAVDAVVAAQLMACIAEPMLTGLGGSGLAMVRVAGRVEFVDFFSSMPGLGAEERTLAPLETIEVDFGPTTQEFHVGAASVAVPGTPCGVWAIHERYGRLPLPLLVEPAVVAARKGLPVDPCAELVFDMLWPIERKTIETLRFARADGPLKKDDICRNPALGETLARFAAEGPEMFRTGHAAQAMVRALGPDCRLTSLDLERYEPRFCQPLSLEFRGAKIWLPAPPSQAGPMVLRSLQELAEGELPEPFGLAGVEQVARALDIAEKERPERIVDALFSDSFIESYLGAGYTTHMSVVDEEGNAAALTSSLGETCGVCVPETGIRPNNFLGEVDVNPPGQPRPAGGRLITMCCPTLATHDECTYAMGSGGSSRIRSALLNGLMYLVGHGLPPEQLVRAPRTHMEEGIVRTEIFGRTPEQVLAIKRCFPNAFIFENYGMYFGGLHVAGMSPSGAIGAGDPRRNGYFGKT